jgi:flagellum-specific peptidoglycan hydrolase FlgJ
LRSKFKQQFYAYMLSLTVLFTMGMSFDAGNNNYSDVPINPSVEIDSNEQIADFNKLPLTQPSTEDITSVPSQSSTGQSQDPVQNTEKQQNKELDVIAANYEVTAYYLNVRADANGKSNIINVVKNSDILEVLETTDNGWLKLKLGGYVDDRYAKLISGNDKQPAPVQILSVVHTAVEEVVKPASQPAVNNKNAGVPIEPTSTVKSDSSLTEEHIAQIFEGTALAGQGLEKDILEIEQEYGINAYFTIAVMKIESGHGKSQIAQDKNNLFGLNAIDSDTYNNAFSFETKGESVHKFGQLISEYYVDKGYTSVQKVASKYCQANPKWPALVMSIMKSDYNKLQ